MTSPAPASKESSPRRRSLSEVDGERGELTIAGFPRRRAGRARHVRSGRVAALARNATHGAGTRALPRGAGGQPRAADCGHQRSCARAAGAGLDSMDALRIATGTIVARLSRRDPGCRVPDDRGRLLAHDAQGRSRSCPARAWATAQTPPTAHGPGARSRARPRPRDLPEHRLDHGLNASTFAARVIISTRSDLVSAVTGAIGALKGPLHGGAPGPALDMVFEIGVGRRAPRGAAEKLRAASGSWASATASTGSAIRGPTCSAPPRRVCTRAPAT